MAAVSHRRAGQEVRRLRRDHGWTQEDMSAEIYSRLGVNYQTSARTIWRVEGGHRPSIRKQFAIATVLGTTPSMLWPERARTAA